jgi:dihydrofolate reductase
MRKVICAEYVSVDGVVEYDPSWAGPFWSDELEQMQKEQLFRSDALLLGRVTYEAFAKAWPTMTDTIGFADRMNSLPKHVASRTVKQTEWNATVIEGDVAEGVSSLKQEPGDDILIYGSADLVHTLIHHDLIDEYRLMVHPVVVGRGKRLFTGEVHNKMLRLADTKTLRSGVVVLFYEPAREGRR